MRKLFALLVACILLSTLAACSGGTAGKQADGGPPPAKEQQKEAVPQQPTYETAEDYLTALKEDGCPIGEIHVWTEETDPNGKLGRPNQYTFKADFTDTTMDNTNMLTPVDEYGLPGGTIEVFKNKEDCTARYDYLKKMSDPSMGAFGVNQYMYKSDYALLRVSYDVTPSNATVYESAFVKITGQK